MVPQTRTTVAEPGAEHRVLVTDHGRLVVIVSLSDVSRTATWLMNTALGSAAVCDRARHRRTGRGRQKSAQIRSPRCRTPAGCEARWAAAGRRRERISARLFCRTELRTVQSSCPTCSQRFLRWWPSNCVAEPASYSPSGRRSRARRAFLRAAGAGALAGAFPRTLFVCKDGKASPPSPADRSGLAAFRQPCDMRRGTASTPRAGLRSRRRHCDIGKRDGMATACRAGRCQLCVVRGAYSAPPLTSNPSRPSELACRSGVQACNSLWKPTTRPDIVIAS